MDKTSNRDACKSQVFGLDVPNSPGPLELQLHDVFSEQVESGHRPGVIVMKRGTIIKADHIRSVRSHKGLGDIDGYGRRRLTTGKPGMMIYVAGIEPSSDMPVTQSPSRDFPKGYKPGPDVRTRWSTSFGTIRRLPDFVKVSYTPLYYAAYGDVDAEDADKAVYVCSVQRRFRHILTINPDNVHEVFYLEEGDDLGGLHARVTEQYKDVEPTQGAPRRPNLKVYVHTTDGTIEDAINMLRENFGEIEILKTSTIEGAIGRWKHFLSVLASTPEAHPDFPQWDRVKISNDDETIRMSVELLT